MLDKLFLDANILIDFRLEQGKNESLKRLFEIIGKQQAYGACDIGVVQIINYVIAKREGYHNAKAYIASIAKSISIFSNGETELRMALELPFDDLEDSLRLATASINQCTHLITSDKKLQKLIFAMGLRIQSVESYVSEFTASAP